MSSIEKKIEQYKCYWLKEYLKELISNKDLKTYNRLKCMIYYFPDMLNGLTPSDIKAALKYCDETYICLGIEDIRYKAFDKIYKKKNDGKEFEPLNWGECRYITIGDVFNYFKI